MIGLTGIGAAGVHSGYQAYGARSAYAVHAARQGSTAPVEPVEEAPAVTGQQRGTLLFAPESACEPFQGQDVSGIGLTARKGTDPVEMAVRGRIRYLSEDELEELMARLRGEKELSPAQEQAAQAAEKEKRAEEAKKAEEAKEARAEELSPAEAAEEGECQTCKERKYQDGSDDPGVSFKTPGHIAPEQAAAVVRGHEQEHVAREQARASREGREVLRQSVALHTAICPECGTSYVSGGTTTTVTRMVQQTSAAQAAGFEAVA